MSKFSKIPSKILGSKRGLMIISLILSFIVWYAFTLNYNPISTRTLKSVPISFDTSDTAISKLGLDIVSHNIDSVDVVISGKTATVYNVKESDLVITPSLSSVNEAGTYELTLSCTKSNILSDFDVVSISPSKVKVTVDSIVTRTFNVTPSAIGATAVDGLVCESPTITDSQHKTISITGSKSKIDKIATVSATANINKQLSKTSEFEAGIILLDKNGKKIDSSDLDLGFDSAKITVSISKIKEVKINAVFENAPAKPSFGFTLSTDTVEVIGDPEIIDSLTSVDLLPIDYRQITKKNSSFDCGLDLPTGVRVYDELSSVNVKFDTNGMVLKTLKVSALNSTNLTSALSSVRLNSPVTVTVCGTKAQVGKISAENITLNVDLQSYSVSGDYTVTATVSIAPEFDSVWAVVSDKDYNAYVTIS